MKKPFLSLVLVLLVFSAIVIAIEPVEQVSQIDTSNCFLGVPYAYNSITQKQIDSGEIKVYANNPCEVDY